MQWAQKLLNSSFLSFGRTLSCFLPLEMFLENEVIISEIWCPKLAEVPYAILKFTGMRHQDVAIYTCAERHQLIGGNANRTCQQNGTWSGSRPICEGKLMLILQDVQFR
jgi:hypothetical protein